MHDQPPPCHVAGSKPNRCAADLFRWNVEGSGSLHCHWQGWRIAGRCLVAPGGVRLPIDRVGAA